jgi:glycosyltransferase involved in cell wall biosynthesis
MIKVLVVGGPVEHYIERCLKSLALQMHTDWEAQVVLDPFKDLSYEKALVWQSDQIKVHINPTRLTALPNLIMAAEMLHPADDDILVTLDADDWLYDINSLSIVASYYQRFPELLLTHGSWEAYPFPQSKTNNAPYTEEEFKGNIRKLPWRASHLRTFKQKLWKKVKDEDLRDERGNYYESAWDLAMMWPMLEMAGFSRVKFIPEKLLIYNMENPSGDTKLRVKQQMYYTDYLARKTPYECLE